MCSLLHLKIVDDRSGLEAKPDALRVLQLAVVVDKYDCASVLRLQCIGLLHRISAEDPQIVAAAAYVLDDPVSFRAATQRWIMDNRNNNVHKALREGRLCRYVPARLFGEWRWVYWSGVFARRTLTARRYCGT